MLDLKSNFEEFATLSSPPRPSIPSQRLIAENSAPNLSIWHLVPSHIVGVNSNKNNKDTDYVLQLTALNMPPEPLLDRLSHPCYCQLLPIRLCRISYPILS